MSVGKIELNIENISREDTYKIQEIVTALIACGGWNLKNGKAILHFDSFGTFQGVQLDYWAFKRKTVDKHFDTR